MGHSKMYIVIGTRGRYCHRCILVQTASYVLESVATEGETRMSWGEYQRCRNEISKLDKVVRSIELLVNPRLCAKHFRIGRRIVSAARDATTHHSMW